MKGLQVFDEERFNIIFESAFFDDTFKLTSPQQNYVIQQYYYYVSFFPKLLSIALTKCTSDEQRLPILTNLWEEHGSGDLNESHRTTYERLIKKLNLDLVPIKSKGLKNVLSKMETTLTDYSFHEVLTFIAYGLEYITPKLYQRLMNKLTIIDKIEEDFFQFHVECDHEHFQELAHGCQFDENSFLKALQFEKELWDNFYKELEEIKND